MTGWTEKAVTSTDSFIARDINTDGILAELAVIGTAIIFFIISIITFFTVVRLILGISTMS